MSSAPPSKRVRENGGSAVSAPAAAATDRKRKHAKQRDRMQPPQRLRSIVRKHADPNSAEMNAHKSLYLGALKYLPHAIYKLIESLPAPWEAEKEVEVLYHTSGALTFVKNVPKVQPSLYLAQWGSVWVQMQEEKRARTLFRRMRLPPFDDEEPMLHWEDVCEYFPTWPDPVELGPEVGSGDFEDLMLALPFFAPDHHFSNYLQGSMRPPALYDQVSFEVAKIQNIQIPNGGPTFEPVGGVKPDYGFFTAFDDPQRIIVSRSPFPATAEMMVGYPYLYGTFGMAKPGNMELPCIYFPSNAMVTRHDNKRAFFLDSTVTPIPDSMLPVRSMATETNAVPFLSDLDFSDDDLAQALALHNTDYPLQPQVKKRRPQDVPLVKRLFTKRRPLPIMKPKTRRSYQRLLKQSIKNRLVSKRLHRSPGSGNGKSLLNALASTEYFETTKIDWLEAGMQLCRQGHQSLQLLIHKRGLHFMHLDYNFNIKPTKTLTTKERKRSRFGNSFHMVRELLKLVKLLVDCRLQFRMGNVDAYELNDAITYIFTHMGQLTGIYRYKYKVMHQITACNDLKHVIYDRFNRDGVGKGPGCGIWQPMWCVWLAFLRGGIPLLERWLGNLIQRQFFGRVSKGISKTVTKQRLESHYDLELRASVLHDILDLMPESLRNSKSKVIMEHLSEAWRCWKANIPWEVEGMPAPIKDMIDRFIQARSEHWTRMTHLHRERIRAGKVVDKAIARKNLGRLTRLWMREEQTRQEAYANDGPYLQPEDAVVMYKTMSSFLRESKFRNVIPFPASSHSSNDKNLLLLALEGLRDEYNMMGRLSNTQRQELLLIEQAYDSPYEALNTIKNSLLTQRVFKNVDVSLLDFHSHVTPVYRVDMAEKIVDAYLDQYLWYEAERRQLFPDWLKPSDGEVTPIMVRNFCAKFNSLTEIWDTENNASSALIHVKLNNFIENCDLTLLNQLLKLVVDGSIADYITAKMNASLSFKDMLHVNQVGIIRGFQFSSFVVQYYLLMADLLILGLPRALDLYHQDTFGTGLVDEHPIKLYTRYIDEVYIAFHLSNDDAEEMRQDFMSNEDSSNILSDFPVKNCWPVDHTMRMIRNDVLLGRALYDEITQRVPDVLGSVECADASVYSSDNPAIMFDMAGFEIRLIPKKNLIEDEQNMESAVWSFTDGENGEKTGFASVRVSKESINRFENRVRQILMSSGSTTFAKIVKRWNTTLTALATYFREAAVFTPELLDVIVKCEVRVQNKVMMGLNSKMPARFPPCVFYSPEELGGLGMLSASHVMIPSSDIFGGVQQFKFGIGNKEEAIIPNLFRYINSWESEATDSRRVWAEYTSKRVEAQNMNIRISMEDVEKIWDRGLPRISTLFQKDRSVLASDKGFRVRQLYRNYSNEKYDPFWWVNNRHDGRLWNFTLYRADVVQALGGIRSILEHTLFKGTGFEDWEGLFWQKQSGFEQQMQMQKLTNAQRSGLSQIPNRRFTLWWSPTINRANVYIGFLVQLDLTGIFLHGKIPTLKISYIQIFRAHLWQKIHESLVLDICQIIDNEQSVLQIEGIEKLPVHPRKSYRMNASAADILLKCTSGPVGGWPISRPSLLNSDDDKFDFTTSSDYWIDIQLRYGDFDSHDITKYTRAKFLDYTTDGVSMYPSKTGLIVCFDLAYNTYDAYGHWFPGLKKLMRGALAKIKQANPSLFILRERIRKALQLHQTQNQQPHLNASNFLDFLTGKKILVDDSAVYQVTLHKTKNGNMASKPVNGALFTLNPNTGKMYMQIIHASTAWAGKKKLSSVSKWKAAEEEASLIRTLPDEDRPEQVIISTKGLRDPMEVNMLEFSGVSVRNSELKLPFSALLHIQKFRDLVEQATQAETHTFELYDDWLDISQPSTAFSRLMLLLRAFLVNPSEAAAIFSRHKQNSSSNQSMTRSVYVWPRFTREQWVDVENEMSDMVVEEHCKSNGINAKMLTQSEIRDIILGQPLHAPPSIEDGDATEGAKVLDNGKNYSDEGFARTTKTHNVHGDEITVVTTSNYEKQQFESRNTWRNRALEAASTLQYLSQNLSTDDHHTKFDPETPKLSIPSSIVSQFVSICDPRNLVIGLLYGRYTEDKQLHVEAIAIIPQLGSATTVMFSTVPSSLPDGEGLQLLGYIRTQPVSRSDGHIPPADLTILGGRSELWKSSIVLVVNIKEGEVVLESFKPTKAGLEWGSTNRDLLSSQPDGYHGDKFAAPVETKLDKKDDGFFYIPEDNVWNYVFMSSVFNSKAEPLMKVGSPIHYFDSEHRAIHFSGLDRLEDGFEVDDFED